MGAGEFGGDLDRAMRQFVILTVDVAHHLPAVGQQAFGENPPYPLACTGNDRDLCHGRGF